jgi:SAM-dependent methyltransferase
MPQTDHKHKIAVERFDLPSKRNMIGVEGEVWRPPLFVKPGGVFSRAKAGARRFLDLQAGSIWRDLKRVLPQTRGIVLDVGCGAQPYRSLIPAATTYIGIDTVDANLHFGYNLPGARYFHGDVWPVEDGSVDFVLCTETLEHVPEPAVLLSQAFRCLAPGGTLLLTVPFSARWHFIPYDYWRFTPSGLDQLLTQAGFINRRVYARGNAGTVACYKAMALLLRMALPQNRSLKSLLLRLISVPLAPLLLGLAITGNVSMRGRGGDDCLGYTALADRPG